MIGPDDLVPASVYRFDYQVNSITHCILGTYLRSTIEHGILWFWFEQEGVGEVPFAYEDLGHLRKVES